MSCQRNSIARLCLAVALLIVGGSLAPPGAQAIRVASKLGTNSTTSGGNDNDTRAATGDSRVSFTLGYGSVKPWMVILWRREVYSRPKYTPGWRGYDDLVAGYGIRVGDRFMICSLESDLLSTSEKDEPDPTEYIPRVDINTTWGKQWRTPKGDVMAPRKLRRRHILTFNGDMALYRINTLASLGPSADVSSEILPLGLSKVAIIDEPAPENAESSAHCRLYGYMWNNDQTLRSFSWWPVTCEQMNCGPDRNEQCEKDPNYDTSRLIKCKLPEEGIDERVQVWGVYSDMGAPVMCGLGDKERLAYVVVSPKYHKGYYKDAGRHWFLTVKVAEHKEAIEYAMDVFGRMNDTTKC